MGDLRYATAHEALIDAFPELRICYERLFDDWDNFGGEPSGQYIVFRDVLAPFIVVLLTLPEETRSRHELLRRALDIGEKMLREGDQEIQSLAVDSVAETFDLHPPVAALPWTGGGPATKRWFGSESRDDWERDSPREMIDLWGVRAVIAEQLPEVSLNDVPGISHPADYLAFESLEDAKRVEDGVVVLATYGTTRLYAVSHAGLVSAGHDALDRAARALALALDGEDAHSKAGVRYRRIPPGERVWYLTTEGESIPAGFSTSGASCGLSTLVGQNPIMSSATSAPAEIELEEPVGEDEIERDRPWIVIVWNDPINLMSYVTFVFQKLFGYSEPKATKLMLQVHNEGKAVVSGGTREKAEYDVARLHAHGLWATMRQD